MGFNWFKNYNNNNRYKRDPALDLTDVAIIYFDTIRHKNGGDYCNRDNKTIKNHFFYVYRYDPVPHTGGFSLGRYYRRFRTTQERRINQGLIHDGMGQFIRARRNSSNLPDCWDDERIAKTGKCWKKQSKKRKQWM